MEDRGKGEVNAEYERGEYTTLLLAEFHKNS